MQEIIYQDKTKIYREKLKYEDAAIKIQFSVDKLKEKGLTVTTGDLIDLLNGGHALTTQAVQKTGWKPSPEALLDDDQKTKEMESIEQKARLFIEPIRKRLKTILLWESPRPIPYQAFEVLKGQVKVTDEWLQAITDENTVYSTPEREKAVELINNIQKAIDALNIYTKGNKMFRAGILIAGSGYRSLASIQEDCTLTTNFEEFNYI